MLTWKRPMSWISQSRLLIVLLSISSLTRCGGQTELVSIEQSSGGSSSSTGGSTGLSGNTNPGVSQGPAPGGSAGMSGFTSSGGSTTLPLDAGLSCNMLASQYDNTCNVDSDCVAVPIGSPCMDGACILCPAAALNARVAYQYLADFAVLNAGYNSSGACRGCPCTTTPCC